MYNECNFKMGLDWCVEIWNTKANEQYEGIDLDNEHFEYPGLMSVRGKWIIELMKEKNVDYGFNTEWAYEEVVDFETIKDARDKLLEVWEYKENNDDDDYMVNDFDVMVDDVELFNDEQEQEGTEWRAKIVSSY